MVLVDVHSFKGDIIKDFMSRTRYLACALHSRIATWQNTLSRRIIIKLHSGRAREHEDAVTSETTSKPSDCAFARLRNLTFNYTAKSGQAPRRSRRIDARATSLGKQCGTVVIRYLPDPLMRAPCSWRNRSPKETFASRFREIASLSVRLCVWITFITIPSPGARHAD